MNRRATEQEKAEARRLYALDLTQDQVAQRVGRSREWVNAVLALRGAGVARPHGLTGRPRSCDYDAVAALYRTGLTLAETAQRAGVSKYAARRAVDATLTCAEQRAVRAQRVAR